MVVGGWKGEFEPVGGGIFRWWEEEEIREKRGWEGEGPGMDTGIR